MGKKITSKKIQDGVWDLYCEKLHIGFYRKRDGVVKLFGLIMPRAYILPKRVKTLREAIALVKESYIGL